MGTQLGHEINGFCKSSWQFRASVALPLAIMASNAAAAVPDETGLTDIVVTAEKRSTNLQDTPISISVLSNQDLEDRHVQSLGDLIGAGVPSLRVTPFASRPFSLIVNMRGVGVMLDANQPARDPGVGVYIDGVYLGRPQGLNAAFYEIESLEILKGPQGTLFGRNTEGGALNIVTRKPSGKFRLDVTAGVGNFSRYEGVVHLDLPEYHKFSVKLDGVITARDGVVKNPLAGASDYGAYSRRGFRAQVQWRPIENFTANYAYDTSRDDSTTLYSNVVQAGSNRIAPILPIQPNRVKSGSVGIPLQPSLGTESGHAVNLAWEVTPTLTLKSITAYRKLYQSQYSNTASGAVFAPNAQFGRYSLAAFAQDQFSQELQAIGEFGRLKYVVGALAYREHVDDMAQTYNSLQFNADGTAATVLPLGSNIRPIPIDIATLFPTAAVDRASRVNAKSYGIYGQATWTPPILGDAIHLTGGLRWTKDQKDGDLYVINNALPIDQFGKSIVLSFNKSWSRIDPMVTIAVDASRDVLFYGKWSRGYKSGGANTRSLSFKPFDPEEISMFEIGAKTEFWDRRGRLNIAAYTGTYKNVQLDFSGPYFSYDANGNIITSATTTRTTTDTINAPGDSKVRGVEVDFTLNPVRGLTLSASYAYNYVSIPATINPFPVFVAGVGTVVSTTPIGIYQAWTPEHAASASIDYSLPLDGFTLRAHLDGNWDTGSYSTDRDPSPTLKAIRSESALVFNGRLSVADIELSSGAKLAVSIWGRNLFNEEHLYSRSISATNGISGNFNDPRTFGIDFKINAF
jgi:iron complex outermembrane recepter protein